MPIINDSNQVQIFTKNDGITEIDLKGDSRCDMCIKNNLNTCKIKFGFNQQKVIVCNCCRERRLNVLNCGPKIKIFENIFPNHAIIDHSKRKLIEYALSKKKLKSNPALAHAREKESSSINKKKESRKSEMVARKPRMKVPSRLTNQVEINDDNSSLGSVSSNQTFNQSSQSENSFDNGMTVIPSSFNLNNRFSFPARTSIQTQASFSMMALEKGKENKEKLKESISNRIGDIEEMLKFQTNIIMRGMKRDLESQQCN